MEMESAAITPSSADSEPLDVDSISSRIEELRVIQRNAMEDFQLSPSEEEKLLNDYAVQLERLDEMLAETSEIGSLPVEDLEKFSEYLKKELNSVETENAKIQNEIEELSRRYMEESSTLESELVGLSYSLDSIEKQRRNSDMQADYSTHSKNETNLLKASSGNNFEILELSHQIEKSRSTLKSLQDLDSSVKRFEVVEKIEDAFSGLKVVEFEGTSMRLSLRTYMPNMQSISCLQKVEDIGEPPEQNHELLLELVDGNMELNNAEIFPNDVYIGEIVDVAKSFRHLYSPFPLLDTTSSLEWFVRRVQDRIVICTLRRFVVKSSNKSRHSFEYLDRDEIIVAHMVGGIDAFIKMPQGWPIVSAALTLLTLKGSSNYSNDISLSFLCKVVDVANSLDEHRRHDILTFADCIEEILLKQMQAEGQPDHAIEK